MKPNQATAGLTAAALMWTQLAGASSAQDCSLALVLAMDISRSMDSTDFSLEFRGTAAALRDPEVQAAILAQPGGVVMTAFEWGGQTHQSIIEGWTMLATQQDIEAFADSIAEHGRGAMGQHTGTGSALEFAYKVISTGPRCESLMIDVSSDGYNNDGPSPVDFYATAPPDYVTVNALVIGGKSRPVLWEYFKDDVIHGPGAFTIGTYGFEDYAKAIKEKFLREIQPAALLAGSVPDR